VTDIVIEGGRALLGGEFMEGSLSIAAGNISGIDVSHGRHALELDARGLLVLPGIVDIHGDAFERQMMPRPRVDFPIDVALVDSNRQAITNGITTVFHAATWSWEPGLRWGDHAQELLEAIESLRPTLAADTRFHLRHETYNLDAEEQIGEWLASRRVDLFAFNDHTENMVALLNKPNKRRSMVERTGLSDQAFDTLVEHILSRADAVPGSIARLAKIAREAVVRILSHDDASPAMRQGFRAQGVTIAGFPINEETAREAAAGGDAIVFGAPNVVRGGSHTGWTKASDMIAKGPCSMLASDYYYPAPAAGRLPPGRRRRAAAGQGLRPDLRRPREGCGSFRPRQFDRRTARRHAARRRRHAQAPAYRRRDCGWPPGAFDRCRSHRRVRPPSRGDRRRMNLP
jgi:alpha-D-ribose 1-methylphosphonate 5-triphosphate diphosphatase